MNADAIREAYGAVRAAAGAASPWSPRRSTSPPRTWASSLQAGIETVGENRVQDMVRKHELHGGTVPVALHRRAAVEQGTRRERDLRARPRRRYRLGRAPPDDSVAARGQPRRRGVEERGGRERDRGLRRALPADRGPDDDAAVRRRSGGEPADCSGASPGWRASTASPSCRWGRRRTGESQSRRERR